MTDTMTLEELRNDVARLLAASPVSPGTQCDIAARFDAAIRERENLRAVLRDKLGAQDEYTRTAKDWQRRAERAEYEFGEARKECQEWKRVAGVRAFAADAADAYHAKYDEAVAELAALQKRIAASGG